MGLDVSLRKCIEFDKARKLEKDYEALSEKNWEDAGGWQKISEAEKDKVRAKNEKAALEMGLDSDGSWAEQEDVELDSKINPKHMFKIGYLRSSYNSSGINSVMDNYIGMTLYDVFEPGDNYYVRPDWHRAKEQIQLMIKLLKDKVKSCGGFYRVQSVNFWHMDKCKIDSSEGAMELFMKELEQRKKSKEANKKAGRPDLMGGSYSNGHGEFHLEDNLEVAGLIKGHAQFSMGGEKKEPTMYVVYKDTEWDWYLESLQITEEMIDYVLEQPNTEHYFLGWSA